MTPADMIGSISELLVKTPQSNDDNYRRLVAIMQEIGTESHKQDQQWGGPAHDDTHHLTDWYRFIEYQMFRSNDDVQAWVKATYDTVIPDRDPTPAECVSMDILGRERLIKIATLAIKAVLSIDRKKEGHDAANT